MSGKLRLLPVMIVAAVMVLGLKVGGLWRGAEEMVGGLTFAQARAQETEAKAEAPPPAAALDDDGKADTGLFAGPDGEEESELRQRLRARIEAMVQEELEEALNRFRPPTDMEALFTRTEVEVLQSLMKRREKLEKRSNELDMRGNLLSAAEKRIDGKIGELKKLEATIKSLLAQHDEQEEAQMKSLVRIYENMKPKDAARIFEELDMEILLKVASRMRESKMASILAQVDSAKAKAITVELATRKQLPAIDG